MRVSKILYHGTTVLRWSFIKRNGLLSSNMSKSFEADEYLGLNTGYVYLTTNVDEAIWYGLNKSLLDMAYLDIPKTMTLNPNYRDPVVLGINAFKLGDNMEIDPQLNTSLAQITDEQFQNFQNKNTQWYRYKGDIKLKHLSAYKYVPFDTFSSNLINEMMKINEEKLHMSQLISANAKSPKMMAMSMGGFK